MLPGIKLFDLTDHVAVVTGGSKGLGKAMAAGLASAGSRVALVSRNQSEVDEAAAEIARDLDISVNSVYQAKSRVLKRMRQQFGDMLD